MPDIEHFAKCIWCNYRAISPGSNMYLCLWCRKCLEAAGMNVKIKTLRGSNQFTKVPKEQDKSTNPIDFLGNVPKEQL